jgi:hypothetical protein
MRHFYSVKLRALGNVGVSTGGIKIKGSPSTRISARLEGDTATSCFISVVVIQLACSSHGDPYFMRQVIPNACGALADTVVILAHAVASLLMLWLLFIAGTLALLHVLLNRRDIDIGPVLAGFKEFTADLPVDMRGQALVCVCVVLPAGHYHYHHHCYPAEPVRPHSHRTQLIRAA